MKNETLRFSFILLALSFSSVVLSAPTVSYKQDVRPILHDYCLNCHEPGGKGYEKSGLDMRSYDSLMKGTKYGSIIIPGDSFTSIMIQAVEGRVHPSIKMPYGMSGGLSKTHINVLKKWVEQGAKNN